MGHAMRSGDETAPIFCALGHPVLTGKELLDVTSQHLSLLTSQWSPHYDSWPLLLPPSHGMFLGSVALVANQQVRNV